MGISIGMVGLGAFAACFVDFFKAHPLVDRIAFCDREIDRAKKWADDPFMAKKLNSTPVYGSLDEICKSDLDALVIITQPSLHAPQAIQAMRSGKDVYSAVPIIFIPDDDEILDCIGKIIETSERTGRHYMLGETTCYRPQVQYCRRKAREGGFGDFVYAEGEYNHDMDSPGCNLRIVRKRRNESAAGKEGDEMLENYYRRGFRGGPMHYPTHSCSGPAFIMDTHATKVTAYGYANRENDPDFRRDAFSNEFAFFKMANGATVRIAETRETPGVIGTVDAEMCRVMGTRGAFSENRWFKTDRPSREVALDPQPEDLTAEKLNYEFKKLEDKDMFEPLPKEVEDMFKLAMNKNASIEELKDTDFKPTGHGGSHPYLVHEFVSTVYEGRQSVINPWIAARFMTMGVMAHKSALKDGETLAVPDWGLPKD